MFPDMQADDSGSHHRKTWRVLAPSVNRGVGTLNGELHQVFNVSAVYFVTEGFIEDSMAVEMQLHLLLRRLRRRQRRRCREHYLPEMSLH